MELTKIINFIIKKKYQEYINMLLKYFIAGSSCPQNITYQKYFPITHFEYNLHYHVVLKMLCNALKNIWFW